MNIIAFFSFLNQIRFKIIKKTTNKQKNLNELT